MERIYADLVVVGGGSAGMGAAIAAARLGADVLVIEQGNAFGGTSTIGGLNEFFASTEKLGNVFGDMYEGLKKAGQLFEGRYYNNEYLKLIWNRLAKKSGLRALYNATVFEAEVEAGNVKALKVACCGQSLRIEGKVFIDATGEGDLAFAAGADFDIGHPENELSLHMTLTFLLADTGKAVTPWLPEGLLPINSAEELPGLNAHKLFADGRVSCNMTKVMGQSPVDPLSLSEAEDWAREQMIRIIHYLQTFFYPTHTLVSSGAHIGIREGRRIKCDYTITSQDILNGSLTAPRDDFMAVATSAIDFHSLTKAGHGGWRERVEPYGIPFSAMTVAGFKNLLVAGKCISGDQVAMSSYRMTPTCCAMGQAAGSATYLALSQEVEDIRDIDLEKLQGILAENDLVTDPREHNAFAPQYSAKEGSE